MFRRHENRELLSVNLLFTQPIKIHRFYDHITHNLDLHAAFLIL